MNNYGSRRAHQRRTTLITLAVSSVTSSSQHPKDCRKARFVGRDVGEGGLGLETLMPLEIGDLLELKLLLPGSQEPIAAEAVARNIREEKRGSVTVYLVGLEFLRIAPEDRKRIANYSKDTGFIV